MMKVLLCLMCFMTMIGCSSASPDGSAETPLSDAQDLDGMVVLQVTALNNGTTRRIANITITAVNYTDNDIVFLKCDFRALENGIESDVLFNHKLLVNDIDDVYGALMSGQSQTDTVLFQALRTESFDRVTWSCSYQPSGSSDRVFFAGAS